MLILKQHRDHTQKKLAAQLTTAYTWEVVDLEAVADCSQWQILGQSAASWGQTYRQLADFVDLITFGEEADLAAVVDCRQSRKGFKQLEK